MWNAVEKHFPELLRSGLIGLVGLEAEEECLIEMLEGGLGLSGKFFGVRLYDLAGGFQGKKEEFRERVLGNFLELSLNSAGALLACVGAL